MSRLPNEVMALYPYQVSGGMQQRVTIATELALRPALVILVEPPTAVDARVKREIVSILQTMRNKAQHKLSAHKSRHPPCTQPCRPGGGPAGG